MRRLHKGLTLSADQVADEQLKEQARLVKKILEYAKKNGIHVGAYETWMTRKGTQTQCTILVENSNGGRFEPGTKEPSVTGFSDDMRGIVNKSERAVVIERGEYEGFFDWSADTYIKEASSVTFTL